MFKFIRNKIRFLVCQKNYAKKLESLRKNSDRKIKVVFLITENQKWCYQSIYDYFKNDELFEPLVLVSIINSAAKGQDKTRQNVEENYEFFKSRGMNVDYAYKNNKYIDLKTFNPDIVFYDQPCVLPPLHKPLRVSKFALIAYCDYGLELVEDDVNYTDNFHHLLWKFFADSSLNILRYVKYHKGNSFNCVSAGYPKLDVYFDDNKFQESDIWKNPEKYKIIYAPHHSFSGDRLNFATFQWNGKEILEFAKSHPETTWIFKPHPRLKFALWQQGIMTNEEIEAYYAEWDKIGKVYTQGAYFDIFKSSDLLITDCCSFLGEYLPTKKPIIRFINKDSLSLNEFGEKIAKSCYEIASWEEFLSTYNTVAENKDDYKFQDRVDALKYLIDFNEKSADKICKAIKEYIFGGNV